jgi:hypothetical protein
MLLNGYRRCAYLAIVYLCKFSTKGRTLFFVGIDSTAFTCIESYLTIFHFGAYPAVLFSR